ncbi:MAG: thioesterase family protein [Actinomycetota bacterium]|nr:thioesterase family protein [Actinomycetota bacterium]
MTPGLRHLVDILTLEPDDTPDTYVGAPSSADGVDATFGGHFLGQAVAAACATVEPERRIHSLHAYFLRGGRPGQPFRLEVERVRDGRSFCTRRVRTSQGEQGSGVLFDLTASFAVPEGGPQMTSPLPIDFHSLPSPDSLPTYGQLMRSLDPLPLPAEWALRDYGLDIRTVDAPWSRPPGSTSSDGGIRLWVRADRTQPDKPGLPEDPALHASILAYQSDESLADNVAIPWGLTWGNEDVVFVSLDHAIWFHRPIDLNEWLFIDQRPVTVGHGRGLATATVWDPSGRHVCTFTQEALLRIDDRYLRAGDDA